MVEVKGYFKEIINLISDYNNNDKSLSNLEINILKEIFNLLKEPKFYYIPQHIEDYEYSKNNYNNMMFHDNFVIETEIESYELVSKNVKMKTYTPTVYIYIKEFDKNFENISLISNSKIKNNFFIAIRKHNGQWQIPSIGFSIYDDKLLIVELFKKRHFDFIQSQKQVNIQECLNILIKKTHHLHKNHIQTINNKNIDFLNHTVSSIDYQIPSFLITKINKIDINKQMIRQNDDNEYKGALDDLYYYGVRLNECNK